MKMKPKQTGINFLSLEKVLKQEVDTQEFTWTNDSIIAPNSNSLFLTFLFHC